MPPPTHNPCAERTNIEALAAAELPHADRPAAELHLESCPACRTLFRRLTADRFPKIRNYTILAELGRGGFGVVYKAFQHTKKRTEALKVLFDKSAQRTAFFENEVRLVAQLQHPNIAMLYEANLSAQPLYYTMEFVAGQHLDDYLRGSEVSLERRLELFKTVCGALTYAHRQGVVHRDLKPQNILIDAQGQPRLVDFGIAKKLGLQAELPLVHDGTPEPAAGALGTYGYIAPEQMAGQEVDGRADIYSLGALLFHVVTGQPARFAPRIDRLREVLHEREVTRADDLATIIACCVRPLPEERYPNCEALVADLDHYLAGRGIRANPDPTPAYRAARLASVVLHSYPLAAQVAAVAAVAALLVFVLWNIVVGWRLPATGAPQVALIGFKTSTVEAIRRGEIGKDLAGLELVNRKSWRLLYGRLMERLAEAQPTVVVWDYFFPDCQPAFDAAFVRGVQALTAPVVVASKEFDVNGEPVLCPDLRAVVHGWGLAAGARPTFANGDVPVPLVVQRGFNPAVPALSLAALTAARHADSDADIHVEAGHLSVRYCKRRPDAGEARWHPHADRLPVVKSEQVPADAGGTMVGDWLRFSAFSTEDLDTWAERAIPFEQVLAAPGEQLRTWFAGKAVLIGKMVPPEDLHYLRPGGPSFGCQLQASVLNTLLMETNLYRFSRWELLLRVCPWGLVAVLLTRLLPRGGTWRLRVVTPAALALLGLTVFAGGLLRQTLTSRLAVEALIAGCAFGACGIAALLVKLTHERQRHLAPETTWPLPAAPASTTLMAPSPLASTPTAAPES
jgi:predicted Ser/Thr protein kinase